ncbi:hypothetical protein TTHERM_000299839 (macronuclear) [Tetrahymena thermophila SB210]|uniref:Uncharacterized protein n=1 Tax=Tetrahymena thermophila (strain SB210) TaxID=312017 RepID=W7XG86_TETTS|nr:hypothetical protein TTHERM_000299839 [Tetrahymena thermophila SB210]EWS71854.1 hypothetical protein TTHERM_000299839 [Tetrahymena thermophila SB210]|eukprot:XP_012655598.1 hypothetical protein TTHERM_000299839 [Tetrahymena thermophila SB210]
MIIQIILQQYKDIFKNQKLSIHQKFLFSQFILLKQILFRKFSFIFINDFAFKLHIQIQQVLKLNINFANFTQYCIFIYIVTSSFLRKLASSNRAKYLLLPIQENLVLVGGAKTEALLPEYLETKQLPVLFIPSISQASGPGTLFEVEIETIKQEIDQNPIYLKFIQILQGQTVLCPIEYKYFLDFFESSTSYCPGPGVTLLV